MARFRLKFLLQEFDLRGPEVIIGRSPDCHITIEDPLVSRQHAKIVIFDAQARIEDLGSRNGVVVNGEKLDGASDLVDGDRIRLGTQELVFYKAKNKKREARTTGFMTVCKQCDTPFPEISPQCPHCGAPNRREDDTITGLVVDPHRSWTFQLLGEVIERAIVTGRASDAERVLRRAAREVDQRLASGERLDPKQITTITGFALSLAKLQGGSEWVHWALNVHRDQTMFPSTVLLDRLEQLDFDQLPEAAMFIDEFMEWASAERDTLRPPPEPERLDRMRRLTLPPDN